MAGRPRQLVAAYMVRNCELYSSSLYGCDVCLKLPARNARTSTRAHNNGHVNCSQSNVATCIYVCVCFYADIQYSTISWIYCVCLCDPYTVGRIPAPRDQRNPSTRLKFRSLHITCSISLAYCVWTSRLVLGHSSVDLHWFFGVYTRNTQEWTFRLEGFLSYNCSINCLNKKSILAEFCQ